jgi:hypothetical protein
MSSSSITEGWRITYTVLASVLAIWWLVSTYYFVKFKESAIIHNRSFWSVLIHVSSLVFFGIFGCIRAVIQSVSCAAGTLMVNVFVNFCASFLTERCILLIANYYIAVQARELGQRHENGLEKEEHVKWLLKHRQHFNHELFSISKLIAFLVAFFISVVEVIVVIVDPTAGDNFYSSECITGLNVKAGIFNNIVFGISVVLQIECARRIKKIEENFYIKRELKYLAFGCLFLILPWIIAAAISSEVRQSQPDLAFYFVFPMVMMYLGMTNVAWLAFKNSKRFSWYSKSKSKSKGKASKSSGRQISRSSLNCKTNEQKIKELLQDHVLRDLFEQFLIQEFSIENVYFLLAVEKYEECAAKPVAPSNRKDIQEQAKEIYERFCKHDSKLLVNLSSATSNTLEKHFNQQSDSSQKINQDLFHQAKKEIIDLLCMDSLRRFWRSSIYLNSGIAQPSQPGQAMVRAVEVMATTTV